MILEDTTPLQQVSIQSTLDSFVECAFARLDVSENTRSDYISRLPLFLSFVKERSFSLNVFLQYKHYLRDRTDFTVSTKNKYLTSCRIFLKELHRIGSIPSDITVNIKNFSQTHKHKRDGLNDAEMNVLIERIKSTAPDARSSRLTAILCLLTLQGLREIEVVRLDVNDIDFVSSLAYVWGKGCDDKEPIHLHPETVRSLKTYMKFNNIAYGALFTCRSNVSKNTRLTTRGLRLIVKQLLNELNIEKVVHGFRHYFTTQLIKTYKGDLLTVAEYTRHRSLEMLQVYNDRIKKEQDLPRYYGAFEGVSFGNKIGV